MKPDRWSILRSRTFWTGVFGATTAAITAYTAIAYGPTDPRVAPWAAVTAALKFLQDAFARQANVEALQEVKHANLEVKRAIENGGAHEAH